MWLAFDCCRPLHSQTGRGTIDSDWLGFSPPNGLQTNWEGFACSQR